MSYFARVKNVLARKFSPSKTEILATCHLLKATNKRDHFRSSMRNNKYLKHGTKKLQLVCTLARGYLYAKHYMQNLNALALPKKFDFV